MHLLKARQRGKISRLKHNIYIHEIDFFLSVRSVYIILCLCYLILYMSNLYKYIVDLSYGVIAKI